MADLEAMKSLIASLLKYVNVHDDAPASNTNLGQSTVADESLCDFSVICGGTEYKVHRLVLPLHSPVLAKAVKGDFNEASDRQIDLSDDGDTCVEALVHYLYSLQYYEDSQIFGGSADLRHHVKMCILADKYDIRPLKAMAVSAFKVSVSATPVKVSELTSAAALAYDTHGAIMAIRKSIVDADIRGKHLSTTRDNALGQVMTQYPELAKEYAQALEGKLAKLQGVQVNAQNGPKRYRCPEIGCGNNMVMDLKAASSNKLYYRCSLCSNTYMALAWQQRPVSDNVVS